MAEPASLTSMLPQLAAALGIGMQGQNAANAAAAQNSQLQLMQSLLNPRAQAMNVANPFGAGGITGAQIPTGPQGLTSLGRFLIGR